MKRVVPALAAIATVAVLVATAAHTEPLMGKIDQASRAFRCSSRAIELLDKVKRLPGAMPNPGMRVMEMALRQPEFMGVLEAKGGLITFSEKGVPIGGSTISEIDPETRAPIELRLLSKPEIKLNRPKLTKYYDALRRTGWTAKQIIVYSQSLRMAACAWALNEDPKVDFVVRRQGRSFQILQRDTSGTRIVASDAMYPSEDGK